MRNEAAWQPTKYIKRKGVLRGSKNRQHLSVQSRLVASLVGAAYSGYINDCARGDLLDLGCGLAPLFEEYSPRASSVTTADWPSSYHRADYTDVYADLRNQLPFKSLSFDTVIFSDVAEHLPRAELAWKEIYRVLRPGGVVIGNTPFLYQIHEDPYDYYRFTEFGLCHLMTSAGLSEIEVSPVGGYLECLSDLLGRGLAQGGPIGRFGTAALLEVMLWWSFSRPGHKVLNKTARKFPLAYMFRAARPG